MNKKNTKKDSSPSDKIPKGHDPITRLSKEEHHFIKTVVEKMSREEVIARLKRDIQTACEIELATIPIYLYSYYSINRTNNKNTNVTNIGEDIDELNIFANRAGSQVMSVAVEEMLHMSLISNIYYAMFGESPKLYGAAPGNYPTPLPYHQAIGTPGPKGEKDAPILIPLASFGYEQLWHFLQIEKPAPFKDSNGNVIQPADRDWVSIGQFYSYIRCLMHSSKLTSADFCKGKASFQIQPYNYAPNNTDTVSPKTKFNPYVPPHEKNSAAKVAEYSNQPDSHAGKTQLITVSSLHEAQLAISTICDQGEGFNVGNKVTEFDDPSEHEESHYYKFLSLQAHFEQYLDRKEVLLCDPTPPDPITPTMNDKELAKKGLIFNFPTNPRTATYNSAMETALSDFCNGLFQYMLIMTEVIFQVEGEEDRDAERQSQKYYFNIALHRSMIWVLDKFIKTMRKINLVDAYGSPTLEVLAPTFEFINLGSATEAFDSLTILGNKAISASKGNPQSSDIEYYINVAINQVEDSHNMGLPNVSDFIKKTN